MLLHSRDCNQAELACLNLVLLSYMGQFSSSENVRDQGLTGDMPELPFFSNKKNNIVVALRIKQSVFPKAQGHYR